MSIVLETRKSNFGCQYWLRFHISFFMTLYYKMQQILIENATTTFFKIVRNVSCKTRQDFYCRDLLQRQFYYKMRQLIKNETISLQNATVITKCDVYYKMRRYMSLFMCVYLYLDIDIQVFLIRNSFIKN